MSPTETHIHCSGAEWQIKQINYQKNRAAASAQTSSATAPSAAAAAAASSAPTSTSSTHTATPTRYYTGTWDVATKILRHEGVSGFYKVCVCVCVCV